MKVIFPWHQWVKYDIIRDITKFGKGACCTVSEQVRRDKLGDSDDSWGCTWTYTRGAKRCVKRAKGSMMEWWGAQKEQRESARSQGSARITTLDESTMWFMHRSRSRRWIIDRMKCLNSGLCRSASHVYFSHSYTSTFPVKIWLWKNISEAPLKILPGEAPDRPHFLHVLHATSSSSMQDVCFHHRCVQNLEGPANREMHCQHACGYIKPTQIRWNPSSFHSIPNPRSTERLFLFHSISNPDPQTYFFLCSKISITTSFQRFPCSSV